MIKQRIITGIILLVLLLAALFGLPAPGWFAVVFCVVMWGVVEWARLANLSVWGSRGYWLLTLAMMAVAVFLDMRHPVYAFRVHLVAYGLAALLWLVVVPLWLMRRWQLRKPLFMALIGWAVLLPAGLAMIDLRVPRPELLLGIMALVWIADVAAYFTGRKFGKHKLAPSISPGKTWEGVAGAVLCVSLYAVLAAWWSGIGKNVQAIAGIVAISWLWVALSVIGDLFESAIKRQAGVKDSGTLLPGHGGLLDRIDALTSTLPMAALVLAVKRLL